MNYFKLFAAILFTLIVTACSDDTNLNTGKATVEFQSTEIELKELASSLNLPLVVKGEHNGLIKVNIALKDNSSGFEDDKGILITEHNLLIPTRTETVNVEIRLSVANDEIIKNRHFSIAIVRIEGATVGINSTCKINLLENSPLEGKYIMEGKSQLQIPNGITSYACTLTSVDDSFEQMYLDFGQGGAAIVDVEPAEAEGEYKLTIAASQSIGSYSGNNVELTHKEIVGGRWVKTTNSITGTFKSKVVTFENGHALGMEVPAIEGWLGLVGSYTNESGRPVPLKLIKNK